MVAGGNCQMSPSSQSTFDGPLSAVAGGIGSYQELVRRSNDRRLIATRWRRSSATTSWAFGLPQTPWPLFHGILDAADRIRHGCVVLRGPVDTRIVDAVSVTILYAVHVRRLPLPYTVGGDVAKGIIYGLVLGLAVGHQAFYVPYTYAPKQGFGLCTSFYGPDGWKLPLSIALWHLTYGFLVGTLYSPIRARQSRLS